MPFPSPTNSVPDTFCGRDGRCVRSRTDPYAHTGRITSYGSYFESSVKSLVRIRIGHQRTPKPVVRLREAYAGHKLKTFRQESRADEPLSGTLAHRACILLQTITGFARESRPADGVNWSWEVRSANGKTLNVRRLLLFLRSLFGRRRFFLCLDLPRHQIRKLWQGAFLERFFEALEGIRTELAGP